MRSRNPQKFANQKTSDAFEVSGHLFIHLLKDSGEMDTEMAPMGKASLGSLDLTTLPQPLNPKDSRASRGGGADRRWRERHGPVRQSS